MSFDKPSAAELGIIKAIRADGDPDPDRLAILADAMEDTGEEDVELLISLRGAIPERNTDEVRRKMFYMFGPAIAPRFLKEEMFMPEVRPLVALLHDPEATHERKLQALQAVAEVINAMPRRDARLSQLLTQWNALKVAVQFPAMQELGQQENYVLRVRQKRSASGILDGVSRVVLQHKEVQPQDPTYGIVASLEPEEILPNMHPAQAELVRNAQQEFQRMISRTYDMQAALRTAVQKRSFVSRLQASWNGSAKAEQQMSNAVYDARKALSDEWKKIEPIAYLHVFGKGDPLTEEAVEAAFADHRKRLEDLEKQYRAIVGQ
jgi:hypothetical protein